MRIRRWVPLVFSFWAMVGWRVLAPPVPQAGPTAARGVVLKLAPRASCGVKAPFKVTVYTRNTPLVGHPVELEVVVANGPAAGTYHSWVAYNEGAIQPTADPLEWTDKLVPYQTVKHTATVRVVSEAPIDLTAKMSVTTASRVRVPAEGYLRMYPFQIAENSSNFTNQNFGAFDPPKWPLITLKDGDKALVIKIR